MTPSAVNDLDRFTGAGAMKPPFHVDFGFFFFLFSPFIDRATARTAEPILMVDGSNDVFSRIEIPFGGHIIT
jgi:hypothetical protein